MVREYWGDVAESCGGLDRGIVGHSAAHEHFGDDRRVAGGSRAVDRDHHADGGVWVLRKDRLSIDFYVASDRLVALHHGGCANTLSDEIVSAVQAKK